MLKLLKYLKPHKKFAIFTLVLAAVNNVLTLAFPLFMSKIINDGINKGDFEMVKKTGLILLACCVVAMLVAFLNSYCSSRVSTGFAGELREDIFKKVQEFSQGDIDKIGISSLITRTTNDVNQVQEFILAALRSIISVPIMLIGGVVMAIIIDPHLSKIFLIVAPIIAIITAIVAKIIMPLFEKIQKKTDKLNRILREKLSGIRVVRAFNRTEYEDNRFKEANDDLTGMFLKVQRTFASLIPVLTALIFGLIIILVLFGYKQVNLLSDPVIIKNTLGNLQAFIIYLVFVIVALSTAAAMLIMIPRANISAKRINKVLETEPELEVEALAREPKENEDLIFNDVSFSYKDENGEENEVLKNVSFKIPKGKVTAIIGSTGSGKSTILNLIPRFYDVTSGSIELCGRDIRTMQFGEIYDKLGYIPQQSFLFSGTIADNMRYGKDDATDEEIWEALDIAQAKDFVEKLPLKLNSVVSQSGTNFSGGQKQRLCIARAVIKKAPFYLFDDSFSALDFITDAKIRKNLKEKLTNSAILIVAQRVGTIIDADNIIVLHKGKVAGMGTHRELLTSCPEYKEIVASQLSEEVAVVG